MTNTNVYAVVWNLKYNMFYYELEVISQLITILLLIKYNLKIQ